MNSYKSYLLKRLMVSVLLVFLISILVFLIIHIIPGDPVRIMLGETADPVIVERIREKLHLNEPLYRQYLIWVGSVLKGDMGVSLSQGTGDIAQAIRIRLPVTLGIGVPAILLAALFGVLSGILCATNRGGFIDQILTILMTGLNGLPLFWISCMAIWYFGLKLKWLPTFGYISVFDSVSGYISHALMPVIIMMLTSMSSVCRQTRTNMLEIINQDYIRTARANGLSERRILCRHALRNALIPIVSLLAIEIRWVVGGSLIVEQIFSINGMGRLIMIAINNSDYLTVQACALVLSVIVVGVNLLLDFAYGWLDPRIRLSAGGGN